MHGPALPFRHRLQLLVPITGCDTSSTSRVDAGSGGVEWRHALPVQLELDPGWPDRMIQASFAVTGAERNLLAARAERGELRRLAPGIYVDSAASAALSDRARHRELIQARQLASSATPIFGHASAAAMWRLPRVDAWPTRTHIIAERASGGRSTPGVIQHRVGRPKSVDSVDGIRVTSLARTVADLARFDDLATAIAAADVAIAGVQLAGRALRATRPQIAAEARQRSTRGSARARFVVEFADPASGSPGESVSRLAIHMAGLPKPALQTRFVDESGRMFVDFCWPEHRLIGEFDGLGKYLRDEWTGGRPAAEVVIAEKRREDRLRALGWRVARWGWSEARSPARLRRILVAAGLR
jgi:hypothetical protein